MGAHSCSTSLRSHYPSHRKLGIIPGFMLPGSVPYKNEETLRLKESIDVDHTKTLPVESVTTAPMCAIAGESKASPRRPSLRQSHDGLIGIPSNDNSFARNHHPAMTPLNVSQTVTMAPTSSATTTSTTSTNDHVNQRLSNFLEARAAGKRLQDQGYFSEALNLYQRALWHANKLRDDSVAPPNALQQDFADTLFDMGCILGARQDLVKSSEAFYACLDIRRQVLPASDPSIAAVLYELALASSSDPEGAMELLLEAHAILNASAPRYTESLAQVWYAIGTLQQAMGESEAAASAFQEAQSLDRIQ